MIGNIKETFPPKTGMREKQVLQDPGYVDTVDTCCMLHAMRQGAVELLVNKPLLNVIGARLECIF